MMDIRYQVKQFITVIRSRRRIFNVYTTGDPKWLLFRTVDPTGTYETGIETAIKRTDLKPEVKKLIRR